MFYRTYSFDGVYGKDELEDRLVDKEYQTGWGLYDDTPFDLAYQEYLSLLRDQERFDLVLLTLDTHMPKGHLSAACRGQKYAVFDNEMLDAVRCSSRVVSRS